VQAENYPSIDVKARHFPKSAQVVKFLYKTLAVLVFCTKYFRSCKETANFANKTLAISVKTVKTN